MQQQIITPQIKTGGNSQNGRRKHAQEQNRDNPARLQFLAGMSQ